MKDADKISSSAKNRLPGASAGNISQKAGALPAVPVLQQQGIEPGQLAEPVPVQQRSSLPAVAAFHANNTVQRLAVNDDKSLESEADTMGARALQQPYSKHAVPVNNTGSTSGNVVQAAGWTHDQLYAKITEETNGVCNALTASYLAGELAADASDDTTGVNTRIWKIIKALKVFLDTAQRELPDELPDGTPLESRHISLAFKPYLEKMGDAWFRGLHNANIRTEAGAFATWFLDTGADGYKKPAKTVEEKFNGKYEDLRLSHAGLAVMNALEANFHLGVAFDGIVAIRSFDDDNDDIGGHQFAIKHEPSRNYTNNKFSIFDQSTGLATKLIRSDDDIIDMLGTHIYKYVTHPLGGGAAESGEFAVMISFN